MSLGLTALELARIQFAFTVSFHIIFPATSIGLACFLAVLEWKWLRTQTRSIKIYLNTGLRSLPLPLVWVWSRVWS